MVQCRLSFVVDAHFRNLTEATIDEIATTRPLDPLPFCPKIVSNDFGILAFVLIVLDDE